MPVTHTLGQNAEVAGAEIGLPHHKNLEIAGQFVFLGPDVLESGALELVYEVRQPRGKTIVVLGTEVDDEAVACQRPALPGDLLGIHLLDQLLPQLLGLDGEGLAPVAPAHRLDDVRRPWFIHCAFDAGLYPPHQTHVCIPPTGSRDPGTR